MRILHIEDQPADSEIVQEKLRREGLAPEIHRVETLDEFTRALQHGTYSLIISDYTLPAMDALDALRLARQQRPGIPFIFLSGTLGEEQAVDCLKLGATDYVLKQRMTRLVPAVRRALQEAREHARRKQAEAELRQSEAKFRALFDHLPDAVFLTIPDGRITAANSAACAMFGMTEAEIIQAGRAGLADPADSRHALALAGRTRTGQMQAELNFIRKNGERFTAEARSVLLGGELLQSFVILRDITERKRAEASAAELKRRLDAALLAGEIATFDWNIPEDRIWGDANLSRLFGIPLDAGNFAPLPAFINAIHPEDRASVTERIKRTIETGAPYEAEYRILTGDQTRWVIARGTAERDQTGRVVRFAGVLVDITERKRAEALLRAALRNVELERSRLAAVLEALPVGVAIADATGKVTQFNAALNRIWGTPLVARNIADYSRWRARWVDTGQPLAPEDWAMARTLTTGQVVPGDIVEIEKFDGSGTATILNAAAPIRDPEGHIIGGVAAEVDITEQRRIQEALRHSEERYRTLFTAIDEGFCIAEVLFDQNQKAVDYRFLTTNPAFAKLLQTPHPEGKTGRELTPDLEDEWFEMFGQVALAGQPLRYQKRVAAWDRWFEGYAFRIGPPEKRQVGILFTDITQRKRAEAAIQRRNQHLQLLQQASARLLVGQQPIELLRQLHRQIAHAFGADVFMLFQADHANGNANDHLHLRACAGVSEEQKHKLQTLRYGRAVCAKPAAALQPIIATQIQTREAPNRRFIRKLGFRSYLYYPLILNNHLHGTVAFASHTRDDYDHADLEFFHTIAGTLAEALERERLERELQRHAAALERKVQERTAKLRETIAELEGFSYSLTHDMRAPLRAMTAYIDMLEIDAGPRLLPEESDMLHRIKVASKRMDQLVTDSLNYSKILRQDLPLGPVNLGGLLHGMVETYPNLHQPHADVSIEFDELMVHGNEAALIQIFSNLLSNAVKFVAPGVHPRVRVRAEMKRESEKGANEDLGRENGRKVRICVEDNGIGIPKEQQEKIFGMFQRMHRAEEYPGTGIGLALVEKSLERTGGEITVESEPGKGSRFSILLPLAAPATEAQVKK